MSADKLDVHSCKTVGDCHYQAEFSALDVEHHPIAAHKTRTRIPQFDVLRANPVRVAGIFKPGLQGLF